VYDAVSLADTQKTAWSVVASGGHLILVLPPAEGITSGQDGKTITQVFGNVNYPGQEVGRELYVRLSELLKDGSIKVRTALAVGSARRFNADVLFSRTVWKCSRKDSMGSPMDWSSCTKTRSAVRSSLRIPRRLYELLIMYKNKYSTWMFEYINLYLSRDERVCPLLIIGRMRLLWGMYTSLA
jgi:hypothetical protein